MNISNKLKKFIHTPVGRHIYSFLKTYITVVLGIYLTLGGFQSELDPALLSEVNLTDMAILSASLKGGLLAVLRNIYKILTEGNK